MQNKANPKGESSATVDGVVGHFSKDGSLFFCDDVQNALAVARHYAHESGSIIDTWPHEGGWAVAVRHRIEKRAEVDPEPEYDYEHFWGTREYQPYGPGSKEGDPPPPGWGADDDD